MIRLLSDKPSFQWDSKSVKNVSCDRYDPQKLEVFLEAVRNSERVTPFVKQKTAEELLDYYLMVEGSFLTNLGVLWIGQRNDRARLSYAPVIQFLKYDENENRVNKLVWDDYSLNPAELIDAVWSQIADWKEGIEIPDGMFRTFIPNYEEVVIRELLTNALVHRPYTSRGDIFINLYPDRLEIRNPGLLPIGVTPQNILHSTIRRNEHLAKVFYDLRLMEREGSGYDKIYETLLSNGKQPPETIEGGDYVNVIVRKRIVKPETIHFLKKINEAFDLTQKETIAIGLIAQHTALSALELERILGLKGRRSVKPWTGRLLNFGLVSARGKTKGTEYFVNPAVLQKVKFTGKTSLKKIESHRLRELIFQDLLVYPQSSLTEVHERIGKEISRRRIKNLIDEMRSSNEVASSNSGRWTRYSINPKPAK
jgi:ATP-dependent DNA helicase RecG